MIEKISQYSRIVVQELRVQTYVLFALYVCIGFALAWPGSSGENFFVQTQLAREGGVLLIALLMVASWYVLAVTLNDIADYEIDAINLPQAADRPLQNGAASKRQLYIVAGGSAVVTLVSGLALGPCVGLLGIIVITLAWAYSMPPIKISHRGIAAQLLLPIGYIVFPMLIAPLHLNIETGINYILLVSGLYLVFVGRVMLKDYRDIEGDAKYGKRTFLLRAGHRATTNTSMVVALTGTGIVALSIYLLTGRIEVSAVVTLLGLLTIPYYKSINQTSDWSRLKLLLPRLGRLLSLQAILLFCAALYASGSITLLVYILSLVLVFYGIFKIITPSSGSEQ